LLITDDVFSNSLHDVEVRFKELVIPKVITKDLIASYVKKAIRIRVWFSLNPYQRALLKALTLSKVYIIRSSVLKGLVSELLVVIERGTLKGKALWYGLLIALSKCRYLGQELLFRIETLLYLGINYLNNPPIFRPYG
jgi:hypothetical protein